MKGMQYLQRIRFNRNYIMKMLPLILHNVSPIGTFSLKKEKMNLQSKTVCVRCPCQQREDTNMSSEDHDVISLEEEEEDEDIPDVATCQVMLRPCIDVIAIRVSESNLFVVKYTFKGEKWLPGKFTLFVFKRSI